MEFRILGELEVSTDGHRPIALGGRKPRTVLAVLLLRANTVVPVDRLIDAVWPDRPPQSAAKNLQTYVWALRRALTDPAEPTPRITTQPAGYLLTVRPGELDVSEFERLSAAGSKIRSTDPAQAAERLSEALALWRGRLLADVDCDIPELAAEATRLDELRWSTLEERIDTDLRCGRATELLAELASLVAAQPLRERLRAQQIRALRASGRRADALAAFHDLRARLNEELGIRPGSELNQLYQSLLGSTRATNRVPRQLPASAVEFTGRADQLRQLDHALLTRRGDPAAGTVPLAVVTGSAGVGKTSLAVHWANRVADRFGDGHLFVNLRGFDASGTVVTPAQAIRGFLDALAVPADHVPSSLEAQTGLYRSLLAGKRMLVVLDNAHDADQIRPLLPGRSQCVVLITSRHRLTGLVVAEGARPVALDVLTDAEAQELLVRRIGANRVAAEPAAAEELVATSGRLPLALCVMTARAISDPTLTLTDLARQLRDTATRLDALDTGDPATTLRATLSWSYGRLEAEAARLFGLLGLAPGPDIGLPAAARLLDRSADRTRALLADLENAHLIRQYSPGRYQLHDLVRLYAADQANRDEPALRRMVDFYLHTAHRAERMLSPERHPIDIGPAAEPHPLPDQAAAMSWLRTEHRCLVAAQQFAAAQGWHRQAWQLAWSLSTLHIRQGHHRDNLTVWHTALAATIALADRNAKAVAHQYLGRVQVRLDQLPEARDHLEQALALFTELDDAANQAFTHRILTGMYEMQGDFRQALAHATQAVHLYRTCDEAGCDAEALGEAGWYHAQLGDHEQARACCTEALAAHRGRNDRESIVNTLDSLGYIEHGTGQFTRALDTYGEALAMAREIDHTAHEATILAHLGDTYAAIGQSEPARRSWQQALHLYQAQHRTAEAQHLRQQLAGLA